MTTYKKASAGCHQQALYVKIHVNELNDQYITDNGSIAGIENQNSLLQKIATDHASYTDSEGKAGSNPQMFIFQIKKRINKEIYEKPEVLCNLYDALKHIIIKGEQSGLTRRAIKDRVYNMIDTFQTGGVSSE